MLRGAGLALNHKRRGCLGLGKSAAGWRFQAKDTGQQTWREECMEKPTCQESWCGKVSGDGIDSGVRPVLVPIAASECCPVLKCSPLFTKTLGFITYYSSLKKCQHFFANANLCFPPFFLVPGRLSNHKTSSGCHKILSPFSQGCLTPPAESLFFFFFFLLGHCR